MTDHEHSELPATPRNERVAIEKLWADVRIVVIDTETCTPPGGGRRVLSVAAVTCRNGTARGRWQTFINAGVPIDPHTQRIHHITEEHLVGEPTFAEIAEGLINQLTPGDGERVVFAAHNVGFDVSALRHECALIGLDLPDIPVLDTMGKLPGLVDVTPDSGSMTALLAALDITNNRPHDAMADASACADAVVELLNRAALRGHTDFDALLAEVSGDATTHTVKAAKRSPKPGRREQRLLPAEHAAGHADILGKRPGKRALATWRASIDECAVLRCPLLEARVLEAQPPLPARLVELEAVLTERAAAGDAAGTATVLGALLPILDGIPPRTGRLGLRNAILAWSKTRAPQLEPLGRCPNGDLCPTCQRGESCPLDTWYDHAAEIALGDPERYARGFFETTGKEAGTGAYTNWIRTGVPRRLADAALWRCVEAWRVVGQDVRAGHVVQLGWDAGCRHPDLADTYAGLLAAPGRTADLDAGIDICDIALRERHDSTHDGWVRVVARRNQLAGRRRRLIERPSGLFDADGNPIPVRRHHPKQPRRTRPGRFIDT